MNKIYKLVWSKTKNMYVAVCEFARSHSKAPKSGVFNRALVAGVLAGVLSCGIASPVLAASFSGGVHGSLSYWGDDSLGTQGYVRGTIDIDDASLTQYVNNIVSNSSSGATTYTAGNGITISSDNKIAAKAGNGITVGTGGIAVKAGTNVTVDANGVSVTGNGTVASGNAGLINGGKLYSEVRPSANGNYVTPNQPNPLPQP